MLFSCNTNTSNRKDDSNLGNRERNSTNGEDVTVQTKSQVSSAPQKPCHSRESKAACSQHAKFLLIDEVPERPKALNVLFQLCSLPCYYVFFGRTFSICYKASSLFVPILEMQSYIYCSY